MKPLDRFDALVQQARAETPPAVDVSGSVLEVILKRRAVAPLVDRFGLDRTLAWFAGGCAIAASLMAMVTWQLMESPMVAELVNPLLVPVVVSQQVLN